MNKKIKVYVSAPYTKGDVALNTANAINASDELLELGFIPFCPHLSHFWHMQHQHSWETWMEYDLAWVESCDCIIRLPGESKGADIEVEKAKELNKPVFYSIEELNKHYSFKNVWEELYCKGGTCYYSVEKIKVLDNPTCSYITIIVDDRLKDGEWILKNTNGDILYSSFTNKGVK
jgi:nucleoside 2-deoxyribosyltransferase